MSRWGAYRRRDGAKYNATPTRCFRGQYHHSGMEARRCDELHALAKAGLVHDLEAHPQPKYDLTVNGVHVCDYLADFRYVEDGREVCEDVKGHRTREYELKRRLMLALHGVEIRETRPR